MPALAIGILIGLAILGLVLKPLRKVTSYILFILLIELVVIIIWPRSLVWLAEVALRLRGVSNLF